MTSGFESGRIGVLGMHRSGTSCVGELLAATGVYLGPMDMGRWPSDSNAHGLYERCDLRRLCHLLLRECRADWWEVARFSPDSVSVAARAHARSGSVGPSGR